MGEREEAEDVVQETYMQAWKSYHRFEAGTNCKAWLFKIMFHVIAHHRRRWFNCSWLKTSLDDLEITYGCEPTILQEISDEEILSSLDKLPESYREVVLLSDVQEFSYKEIAEILQIPLGTVMSRLNRGRKLLRQELSNVASSYGMGAAKPAAKNAVA
jgi:RNA polymerase sigma-70 factor (ECF subfamily)